jgi:hypothetical protein
MSEPEIHMRNPKLRLVVNIVLVALFLIVLIWQVTASMGARAQMRELRSQITILERDVSLNEQSFLTAQTLSEQSRRQMTAQGLVEESQRLQGLRDRLDSCRALCQQRKDQLEILQKQIGMHHLIIIISLVATLILLGVNYILDY